MFLLDVDQVLLFCKFENKLKRFNCKNISQFNLIATRVIVCKEKMEGCESI